MNRFRTKKKSKEEGEDSSSSFFRRNKKHVEEPKPEINLDMALPSEDDFRTSLLMTNLSARFSMLREQDDPNTKIGKASDDSVLQSTGSSRFGEFGFGGGLHDISEVESIKAPPSFSRMDSVASDSDSTLSKSIMDRSRPNEGNNLFGGRQKIFKISAGAANGGMSGRALYDDDVAMSNFQQWRQAQKDAHSREEQAADEALEALRSESPGPNGYNRRRETSSTTSSTSGLARNSTAATSFTSQPSIGKDGQASATSPALMGSAPAPERNVLRTRRLYEQGLTQDMQEHQTSALSRIDTLTRNKNLGSRTPDLGSASPSPTASGFGDRFGGERRTVLTKASAPNLRSISPPSSVSSMANNNAARVPSPPTTKTAFGGGAPPLSPPVSETGEYPLLAANMQPSERSKATALGVFQKPAQPYDESRFAQRQLQLQRGRETPNQRFRTGSNASYVTDRSRSSSSIRRQQVDSKTDAAKPHLPVQVEEGSSYYESEDVPVSAEPVARPSDEEHPALRGSASPVSTSVAPGMSWGEPTAAAHSSTSGQQTPREFSPADSPTLGPASIVPMSGLSGMVRQHLRSDSEASSAYGPPDNDLGVNGTDASFPHERYQSHYSDDSFAREPTSWNAEEREWASSYYGPDASQELAKTAPEQETITEVEEEANEFASQLADARRRVREKLTSYVESDGSRSGSPTPPGENLAITPPVNSLGISMVKPKSSRGSLIDRSRSMASQSKAMKMLGLGSATMSTSPLPTRQSFDDKETSPPIIEEEPRLPDASPPAQEPEADQTSIHSHEEENVHPGLRAFRQARRELQRRKELDMLARHQTSQTGPDGSSDVEKQRSPSRGRLPPRSVPQHLPSDEGSYGRPSMDRNRSDSDATDPRSRSTSRVTRLRNDSATLDPYAPRGAASPTTRQPPMLRSPGLPGTDIRRSPIMPPQGYPSSAGPTPLPSPLPEGLSSSKNLNVGPYYNGMGGQPSPISLSNSSLGPPASPYGHSGVPSPVSPSYSTINSSLEDSMKRSVRKMDISEPTLVMSTSRQHTMSLPEAKAQQTNGFDGEHANSGVPPLPPINPRRKQDSGRAKAADGVTARSVSDDVLPSHARAPFRERRVDNTRSGVFSLSDEDDIANHRKRLRPVKGGIPMVGAPRPQELVTGPPASRTVLVNGVPRKTSAPGGMI